MSTTTANLKEAFAGESQASQKYLAFAKKAEKDGFRNIATLFRAAAEAERIHAEGHLGALDGIKTTADNLQAAIEGETYEFTQMYPPMVEQARSENHRGRIMMAFASEAERIHAGLFARALAALEKDADLPPGEVHLCPACGHVELGAPPDRCPVCGAPAAKYQKIG